MWDPVQKLEYCARAGMDGAQQELNMRLTDRAELPLTVLNGSEEKWLDLSPFVSYMLDAFERCLIDAALSADAPTEAEAKLLERMNKAGIHSEITTKKAAGILGQSENSARVTLNRLVKKGYLTVDTGRVPYIYQLHQHIPHN